VALGVSVLIGTSMAVVLLFTNLIVRSNAVSRATTDLQAARAAFYHLVDDRADFAATELRLVTELPVLRAVLPTPNLVGSHAQAAPTAADDPGTVSEMMEEYRIKLRASFAIYTNATGRWLTSPGWPTTARPPAVIHSIAEAANGRPHRGVFAFNDRLYLIVSEPARFADEVLGTVSAGFQLDDAVARQLAASTRTEVTLLAGTDLSGSSLSAARQGGVRDLVRHDPNALGRVNAAAGLRQIVDGWYVSGTYPVTSSNDTESLGRLVLMQDWQPTQAFVDQVKRGVLIVGSTLFVLALVAGLLVSRRTTGPLSEIARVTGEVAAGHWDRRVPVHGTGETAALALSFNDMTAALSHWHAEAQSKAAELRESYEQFFSVAQSANDAIVSTDDAGRLRFWNVSALRMFGYTDQELHGATIETLLHPDSHAAYHARLDHLRRGHAPLPGTFEAVGVGKSGSVFPIELSLAMWMASNQANFTAMVRDITERTLAADALRRSEIELRQAQKMEAIGRLAGGVAHDFNNLLTAIRGYAQLLTEDLPSGDPRHDDAVQIVKASETAGSLTRQLLAFSRKQILAPKTINLSDIVRSMHKMLGRLIGEDIDLTVEAPIDLWEVRADPGQIEQVVMNLAVNARDAMPTGGTLRISLANLAAQPTGAESAGADRVLLEVTDTGTGMTAETLGNIFEPFFTTKDDGRGTGLGLAMVDGIIEQSGGSIAVDSAPGKGTTFRVYLPRTRDTEPDTRPQEAGKEAPRVFETVLLVEDEPGVRSFASQVLTRHGYQVLEAAHGDDALTQASNHPAPIHLLLTDVVMPGISGRVLWERLSAMRPETHVLFMSGYTDDAVMRHGIGESGLPYLQKPFSVSLLADSVRRALQIDRAQM
jgi:PAS domain S-box-containing protein